MDNGNMTQIKSGSHVVGVNQVTLNELIEGLPQVDLLKVDIEDSTLPVLLATHLEKVQRLHVEVELKINNLANTQALISKIEKDGFQSSFKFFPVSASTLHNHSKETIFGFLYITAGRPD